MVRSCRALVLVGALALVSGCAPDRIPRRRRLRVQCPCDRYPTRAGAVLGCGRRADPARAVRRSDTLRGHLGALTRRGLRATISGFTANGYESTSKAETGGGFTFDLHGRIGSKGAFIDGGGDGMIDCLTGKLKTIVIDNW